MLRAKAAKEAAREKEKLKHRWALPFHDAYVEVQQRRHRFNGAVGPIDIGQLKHRRLLIQFLARGGAAAAPSPRGGGGALPSLLL